MGSSGDAFKSNNSGSDESSGCLKMLNRDRSGSYDSDFVGYTGFTLDASRSSFIYGSSNTVTPSSVSCKFCIKY